MSMRDADLKKKTEKLEFLSRSDNRELYLEAGRGNPRLLEWLDKIAEEEDRYDLTELRIRVSGKQADYVAEYLFEIMAETSGAGFGEFLRRAAVYRKPVPASAFAAFGSKDRLERAAWLTLLETETRPDGDLFWVHPMIREAEWEKLPKHEQKSAHESAADWYRAALENVENRPYMWLHESVFHALSAGRVRQACYYAILLGQMMENMQLYRECLAMQQDVADHVTDAVIAEATDEKDGNVAGLLSDLGAACHMMGDFPNMIEWTEKALNIDKNSFGEDHSRVAVRYNNLGSAYNSLGDYEKAVGYYERALAIGLKNFGENHPKVAIRYNNLGSAYKALGEYEKAVGYYERALAIDLKNFGENHPNVAIRYNNLGSAYNSLGDYEKAVGYYERALAIDLKNFGENHPQVAIYNNNLGEAYRNLGDYEKAFGYYEQALAIDLKNFGENHPSVARKYNNLGGAYDSLGEHEKAVGYFEQALGIFLRFLGPDHPYTKGVRGNLESARKAMEN